MKRFSTIVFTFLLFVSANAALIAQEKIDTAAIAKIKDEGLNRSHVMDILSHLSDLYGPRLTGSPEYKQAAEWAKWQLEQWGLQHVQFASWGPFGRGWTLKKFNAQVDEPRIFPLIAYPKAWSPGLKGLVKGNLVYLDAKKEEDLNNYKGKLKGAFVLVDDARPVLAHWEPEATRKRDGELLDLANAGFPQEQPRRFGGGGNFMSRKLDFCLKEGAVAALDIAPKGDGGTIFVSAATVPQPDSIPFDRRLRPYSMNVPKIIPQVTLTPEHYNRMVRLIQMGQTVKMEMELGVEFTKNEQDGFNIIGEIPGSDLKDEIVMIGAHFDSWHAGTGATDNGTGSSVCLETIRILKALNVQPRRTIRIGLWGGEEQGLLGSRGYVSNTFGEREGSRFNPTGPLKTKPEYEKFSVYFNNDNGTGKVRGVYLQGNEAVRSIFRAWLVPIEGMGASTLSLSNTGGTDHLSFDAIGLPGFQFIQDPIEYGPRTHHSNMDVYDRAQQDDLKQAATIMAAFAYNAAMRDEKIPRKPLPGARPRAASSVN